MILTASPLDLPYKYPFGLSRGVKTVAQNVLVTIEHEGLLGVGEAAPNARFGETQADTIAFLNGLALSNFTSPALIEDVMAYAFGRAGSGYRSALAGLDMALHDWWGKHHNRPVHARWGGSGFVGPVTSYTIGLDTPEVIERKTREVAPYPILKVKLGGAHDEEIIRAVRRVTDKTLRVDANEGWATKEEALARIHRLQQVGVELIEQPMPAGRIQDMAWLKARSPLPLVADEDCIDFASIERLAAGFDGINIKLDKAGGLLEGHRMLMEAERLGLSVMIGCMAGSSISMTAGAHLALEADWADLDGNLLLAHDPFQGVKVNREGRLVLPDQPGLGVRPDSI